MKRILSILIALALPAFSQATGDYQLPKWDGTKFVPQNITPAANSLLSWNGSGAPVALATGPFTTGTDAANLTGTLGAARIADSSLSIAKVANLQTTLDGKAAVDGSNIDTAAKKATFRTAINTIPGTPSVYHRFATLTDGTSIAQGDPIESGGTWKRDIRGVVPTIVNGALVGGVATSLADPNGNSLYYYHVESPEDVTRIAVDLEFLPPRLGTATLTFSGNAAAFQSVQIGTTSSLRTYTFRSPLTGAANEVLIGANAAASRDNLVAAINGGAGAGTVYGTGTTACEYGYATASGSNMVFTSNSATVLASQIVLMEAMGSGAWSSASPVPGVNPGGLIIALGKQALDGGGAGTPGVPNIGLKHGMLHFEVTRAGIKQCQIYRDPADPLNPSAGGITFDGIPAQRQALASGAYVWGGNDAPVVVPYNKRVRLTLEFRGTEFSATCMGWTVRFQDSMFPTHTVGKYLYLESGGDQLSTSFRMAERPALHAFYLNGTGADLNPALGLPVGESTPLAAYWSQRGSINLYGDTGAKLTADALPVANPRIFAGGSGYTAIGSALRIDGGEIVSDSGKFFGNAGYGNIGGATWGRAPLNVLSSNAGATLTSVLSSAAGAETVLKGLGSTSYMENGDMEEYWICGQLVGANPKRIRIPWYAYGGTVFDSNVSGTPLNGVSGPYMLHIIRRFLTGTSHLTYATLYYPGGVLPPQSNSSNHSPNYAPMEFRTTTTDAGGVTMEIFKWQIDRVGTN